MTCSLAAFAPGDESLVFTADELSTLPASNLFKRMPFDRWRTPSASGQVTFSNVPNDISQIVLLYTNATAACTVRVRAADTVFLVTAAPNFDSGTIDHQPGSRDWSTWGRTHFVLDLSVAVSRAAWRIDVNQVSGATYYEAGRVGFLNPYRPSRGIDWGDRIIPIDDSRRRRSRNGTAHSVPAGLHREVELRLTTVTESEFLVTAGDMRRRVESRIPMLYCKRPRAVAIGAPAVGSGTMYRDDDVMDDVIYGYLRDLPYQENDERQVRRMRVALEEVVHP